MNISNLHYYHLNVFLSILPVRLGWGPRWNERRMFEWADMHPHAKQNIVHTYICSICIVVALVSIGYCIVILGMNYSVISLIECSLFSEMYSEITTPWSVFNIQKWIIGIQYSQLSDQFSIINVHWLIFNIHYSVIGIQNSLHSYRYSTFNVQWLVFNIHYSVIRI